MKRDRRCCGTRAGISAAVAAYFLKILVLLLSFSMLFPFENATCVFMLAKICVMLHIYRYGYYTILLKFPPLRFLTFQTIFNAVSLVPRQLSSLVVIAILTIELQSYFVAGGMCCRGMLNVFFCHQSWQLHRRK